MAAEKGRPTETSLAMPAQKENLSQTYVKIAVVVAAYW